MSGLSVFLGSLVGMLAAVRDYFVRLWRFWGPRLTDRGFVGVIFANAAVLGVIDPARVELWQLAVWGAANLFFPLWDSHPAGEKLAPKDDVMLLESSAIDWTPQIEAVVDKVVRKYATGH